MQLKYNNRMLSDISEHVHMSKNFTAGMSTLIHSKAKWGDCTHTLSCFRGQKRETWIKIASFISSSKYFLTGLNILISLQCYKTIEQFSLIQTIARFSPDLYKM